MPKSFPKQTLFSISLHRTAVLSRYAQPHSRSLSSVDTGKNQQVRIAGPQATVIGPFKIPGSAYATAGRENGSRSSIRHDSDTPNPLKNPSQTPPKPQSGRCNLFRFQPDSPEFPVKMPLHSTFSARDLF